MAGSYSEVEPPYVKVNAPYFSKIGQNTVVTPEVSFLARLSSFHSLLAVSNNQRM